MKKPSNKDDAAVVGTMLAAAVMDTMRDGDVGLLKLVSCVCNNSRREKTSRQYTNFCKEVVDTLEHLVDPSSTRLREEASRKMAHFALKTRKDAAGLLEQANAAAEAEDHEMAQELAGQLKALMEERAAFELASNGLATEPYNRMCHVVKTVDKANMLKNVVGQVFRFEPEECDDPDCNCHKDEEELIN